LKKLIVQTIAISLLLMSGARSFAQNSGGDHQSSEHIMTSSESIKWQPLPHEWTNGPPPDVATKNGPPPEVALIWGDPLKEGAPFMFRLRSSVAGTTAPVAPHYHPTDEHITVLSGVFCLGDGDVYDEAKCTDMPAGSVMVMPKGMHHFAVAKNSDIEIYGVGPFKIMWLK